MNQSGSVVNIGDLHQKDLKEKKELGQNNPGIFLHAFSEMYKVIRFSAHATSFRIHGHVRFQAHTRQ